MHTGGLEHVQEVSSEGGWRLLRGARGERSKAAQVGVVWGRGENEEEKESKDRDED